MLLFYQGGEQFKVIVHSATGDLAGRVTDKADGTYAASYVVEAEGPFKLSVQLRDFHSDVHIASSPFEIVATAGTQSCSFPPLIHRFIG